MKERLKRNYNSASYRSKYPFRKIENVILKGGRVVNFEMKKTLQQDILIIKGKIKQVGQLSTDNFDGEVIDVSNQIIAPGLLDMHVHFREPGREDEETLISGAAAAMNGGFTGVCTMPNTHPAADNKEIIEYIKEKFENHLVDVYPIAAITKERKGEQLVDIAELVEAGVVAFSDDGDSVANPLVLRRALEYSNMFDVPIIEHCEDRHLSAGGAMHEGFVSTQLGLPGIPSIAEEIVVARNIMLAKYTGGKIHIAHVSSAGSVELIRRAKNDGVRITCEATPHHFTLTDDSVTSFDTNMKMNPPLRKKEDVAAIIAGLQDGTIDVIATDHAPHSPEEKEVEFIAAPFGIIGLETALALAITQLVDKRKLALVDIIEKMAVNPYKILGLPIPNISEGMVANLSFFDPAAEWQVDINKFKSQSRNSPFHGWLLKGKAMGVSNNQFLYNTNE